MNNDSVDIFHNFFQKNKHLLDLDDYNWPTHRLLFQLGYETLESSIATQAEAFYNAPYKPRITIQTLENIAKAIFEQKDDEYFIKFLSLSKKDALDKWQVWIGLRDIGNKTKLIKKTNK